MSISGCLKFGTLVRPASPAGRWTLFYRDRRGEHHPLAPAVQIRKKLAKWVKPPLPGQEREARTGLQRVINNIRIWITNYQPPEQFSLLVSPKHYRGLLASSDKTVAFTDFRGLNSLPAAAKEMVFEDLRRVFDRIAGQQIMTIVWKNDSLQFFMLRKEPHSGTAYMRALSSTNLS